MEGKNNGQLPDLHSAVVLDEIEDAIARHEEWLLQRVGKFTASEFSRLMTYEDKPEIFPKGAQTFVDEKITEVLTGRPAKEEFDNVYISRGNELEESAIKAFTEITGIDVINTGSRQQFISWEKEVDIKDEEVNLMDHSGCTPDGLIEKDLGIEVKCPKSTTHLSYMRSIRSAQDLKKVKPEYYWQIQGTMMITGRKAWYFMSYDDRFLDDSLQSHIVRIDRNDEDIDKLQNRMLKAVELKLDGLKMIRRSIPKE